MKLYDISLTYKIVKEIASTCSISNSAFAVHYLRSGFEKYPEQESFWVMLLNRKNKVLGRIMIHLGSVCESVVDPKAVFKPALLASASAIIVAHNHPSGDPAPSSPDIQITRALRDVGELLNVQVLDHVILGDKDEDPNGIGYYSFKDNGLI